MVDWIERIREWLSRRPFRGPEPRDEELPVGESDRDEPAELRR